MEIRGQLHDNYMFYFNTNCHEFPTNYHEFYLLSRWRTQNKNNYMEIRGQLHDNYMFLF